MLLFGEGEGGVELSLELPSTRALSDDYSATILTNSVLKLYSVAEDGETTLVRRYEPATEMPEVMYLAAGEYMATLSVGDSSILVSSEAEELCYYGECDIEVVEGQSSSATIECDMRNSIIEVLFEDSIIANFAEGYSLSVVVSDEGAFTETIYEESDFKAEFTDSGSLYFLIDGDDAPAYILWQFKGQRVIDGTVVDDTPITITGKSSAPSSQEKSLLTFKYSNYLIFSSELISIDYSIDIYDDTLHFSPQPTITADGFSIADVLTADSSYSFDVSGLNPLTYAEVYLDGTKITSGYTFTIDPTDDTIGYLTLSSDLFATITTGESCAVEIKVFDEDYGEGSVNVTVACTGVSTMSGVDYWLNTATVTGVVTGSATSVSFDYRQSGSSEWMACDSATSAGAGGYSASINPTWSGAYSNGSYSLLSGVMAGNDYEVRMTVDGVEYTKTISAGGTQHTITGPEGDSDSSCYSYSECEGSTTWASGNTYYGQTLCTYSSGSSYLKAQTVWGTFAAGNLVYGQFTFNGISAQTGTMSFGQALTWTSRPKSFKFTYQSTIGTVTNTGDHLSSSDKDPARVYFAIVDWSSRHSVTAGSGTPSGTWDPVNGMSSVSEGDIIGYASLFITESTSGFIDEEVEIVYYDKTTKPSKSISIVISAVTSAYGDYLEGSTSNRLYIKNFGFGY